MNILRLINRKLEKYFSIRIEKTKKKLTIEKGTGKNNVIVEFIGPSAIGKTTLRKHYIYNYKNKLSRSILSLDKNIDFDSVDLILNPKEDSFYINLLNAKYTSLKINKDWAEIYVKELNFYYQIIKQDYIVNHYYNNTIAFSDEHLMRRFKKLPKYSHLINNDWNLFFKNRVYIACSASIEQLHENIEKRYKTGSHKFEKYNKLSKKDLYSVLEDKIKEDLLHSENLKKLGANVIDINISDGKEINSEKIHKSLQNLL